jgi:hypothetical protein
LIAVLPAAKLQSEELGRQHIDPYIPFQPVRYDVKVMLPPSSLAGLARYIFKHTVEWGGAGVQTNQEAVAFDKKLRLLFLSSLSFFTVWLRRLRP